MNTVKILSLTLVSTFIFLSCQNSEKPKLETEASLNKELAIKESISPEIIASEDFLFVTASTGLSLREYNNLQSKKRKHRLVNSLSYNCEMCRVGLSYKYEHVAFKHS